MTKLPTKEEAKRAAETLGGAGSMRPDVAQLYALRILEAYAAGELVPGPRPLCTHRQNPKSSPCNTDAHWNRIAKAAIELQAENERLLEELERVRERLALVLDEQTWRGDVARLQAENARLREERDLFAEAGRAAEERIVELREDPGRLPRQKLADHLVRVGSSEICVHSNWQPRESCDECPGFELNKENGK